eukprot:TRINITY_DN1974_c0_g1_i5.p1 TRINITY_DN1974_c0_g1~~TRINITY_DN1974_c0_g1_i5.p1  ORF type:complete len:609 (+),score=50.71 TRINITY_DN1974_c0_g1_i5:69-1895(+)
MAAWVDDEELDIFMAAACGNVELCRELIEIQKAYTVNSTDKLGYTALHWAALNNRCNVAEYLLSCGAEADVTQKKIEEVNLKQNEKQDFSASGTTSASEDGEDSDESSEEDSFKFQTPLHWAAIKGNVEITEILLDHGANINRIDSAGNSAAQHASQNGHLVYLHYLYEKGSNIALLDYQGHTCMHWAAYQGHWKIVLWLLTHQQNVNATDIHLCTPLHWAAIRGHAVVARILLEHGADFTLQDSQQFTARDCAIENKNTPVADMLEQVESQGIAWLVPTYAMKSSQKAKQALLFSAPFVLIPLTLYIYSHQIWWHSALYTCAVLFALWQIEPFLTAKRTYNSLFPVGCTVITILILWLFYFFALASELEEYVIMRMMMWIALFCAVALLYRCHISNPGYLKQPVKDIVEAVKNGMTDENFCATCLVHRPFRAKHCSVCNRCVCRFDHHCQWINNCVGYQNNHMFFFLMVSFLVSHFLFAVFIYLYVTTHYEWNGLIGIFGWGVNLYMKETMLCWLFAYNCIWIAWESSIFYMQVVCMWKNLTSVEIIRALNEQKYVFAIRSKVSKGPAHNIQEYFHLIPAPYYMHPPRQTTPHEENGSKETKVLNIL